MRLTLDTGGLAIETCAAEIENLSGVETTQGEGERTLVRIPNANGVLPSILTHLAGPGFRVKAHQIEEPNLEAVFLHMAGRALWD